MPSCSPSANCPPTAEKLSSRYVFICCPLHSSAWPFSAIASFGLVTGNEGTAMSRVGREEQHRSNISVYNHQGWSQGTESKTRQATMRHPSLRAPPSDEPGKPHRIRHLFPATWAATSRIRNSQHWTKLRGEAPDQNIRSTFPLPA